MLIWPVRGQYIITWLSLMHFGLLGFLIMWKETKPRRKHDNFTSFTYISTDMVRSTISNVQAPLSRKRPMIFIVRLHSKTTEGMTLSLDVDHYGRCKKPNMRFLCSGQRPLEVLIQPPVLPVHDIITKSFFSLFWRFFLMMFICIQNDVIFGTVYWPRVFWAVYFV